MPLILGARRRRLWLAAASSLLLAAIGGCAPRPTVGSVSVPPIPANEGRVWVYRDYIPSESLNMTEVTMNGVYAGYSQLGGAFYRDLPPGVYHVAVESYGKDFDQSTNIALVPGEQVYIKIESLRSWSSFGLRTEIGRDTFYARLIPTELARAEIGQSLFDGGS
jgi:hypothetical protein